MAAFPNLNSDAGLKKLDEHLLTRYYITRGISSEGSGVTIDGSASITEEADGNSKDGVVVIDDDDNDQDVDLIGEEAEERPASLIASTKKKISWESIVIVVMPEDDETDMNKLEEQVRSIQMEGLVWGASKLVPVGCGIKLLGIECTTVGHLVHLRRIVTLNTFVKEKIADNPYVKSCQTLCLNRICEYRESIFKLLLKLKYFYIN
uniref:Translation elongation factor EF1B beta/delta subunit guanine nucleotide exchange domain-containing protein n=1 Tax=Brassica campestris TaxID=3711 RepID=M4DKJ9_BRACM